MSTLDVDVAVIELDEDGGVAVDLGGHQGGMAICYEVVYPGLVRSQAAQADVLLNRPEYPQ